MSTKLVVFLPVTGDGGEMKLPLPPFIWSPASLFGLCRPNVMFNWLVEIDIMFSFGTLRANNAPATFPSTLTAVLTDLSPCKMKQNIPNEQVTITKRRKARLTKRAYQQPLKIFWGTCKVCDDLLLVTSKSIDKKLQSQTNKKSLPTTIENFFEALGFATTYCK